MDGLPVTRRRRILLRVAAAAAVLGVAASCSPGTVGGSGGSASSETATATPTLVPTGPVTAEISQFRDNYSKQIIEIQLTNTTDAPLTVLGAELTSPLFAASIPWPARTGGIELPPGQTKSLPAPLPAPECSSPSPAPSGQGTASGADAGNAFVSLRLAAPQGAVQQGTAQQETRPPQAAATAPAADPFGVLARNNSEMCLTREAAAVAAIALASDLEVTADGRTAVLRLLMQPRAASGSGAAGASELVIDRIEETTLLAEAPQAPWPRSLTLRAGGPLAEVRLGIRPSRCDPHAVAEDKVGTLLPLRVRVAGREGVLKIDAGSQLRGRIYDFVTKACGRQ
ncbi:hypothetical protein [Arthrobacter sp. ok362]|uniref:hypothetical protein n=1 Tax=Arthrobacter sp. ok362 TaxID=1761745 RepID=UPI000889746C|nr:hypothetical protein [Arthrobacter sp. ok362]SDK90868.1 hypothetical protein SAMN04487913_10463 [Arthrobacter sp. ok362]